MPFRSLQPEGLGQHSPGLRPGYAVVMVFQAEGLGQLFVRLLTGNFEEAVAARAEKRAPVFTDDK